MKQGEKKLKNFEQDFVFRAMNIPSIPGDLEQLCYLHNQNKSNSALFCGYNDFFQQNNISDKKCISFSSLLLLLKPILLLHQLLLGRFKLIVNL